VRVRRYCERCVRVRIFAVRVRPNGHKQSDCVACSRRRGRSRNPTKITYACMKQRCLNPNEVNFKYYGGRGITICDRWLGPDGFANFVADMGMRPAGRTLDRINGELGYSPENCRWATYKEQVVNRGPRGEEVVRHCTYGTHKKKNYEQIKQG
jgi:hypothetical protein